MIITEHYIFQCSTGHLPWRLRTFYCCWRHKFETKALVRNIQYFI